MVTELDVFPPRSALPGSSAEWGRVVEGRIENNEVGLARTNESLQGLNRSTASSLQGLSRQINDLTGRVSYSEQDITLSDSWTATQTPAPFGPPVLITLTDTRVVSCDYRLTGRAVATGLNNTSGMVSTLQTAIYVDGTYIPGASGRVVASVAANPGAAAYRFNEAATSLSARALLTLTPGDHVIQGYLFIRSIQQTGSGTSSTGIISVNAPQTIVDILQPAASG